MLLLVEGQRWIDPGSGVKTLTWPPTRVVANGLDEVPFEDSIKNTIRDMFTPVGRQERLLLHSKSLTLAFTRALIRPGW